MVEIVAGGNNLLTAMSWGCRVWPRFLPSCCAMDGPQVNLRKRGRLLRCHRWLYYSAVERVIPVRTVFANELLVAQGNSF